ncbi:hypothetical protein ACQKM2_19310 [Streptomyces sp. NPDC004126]|uniref:hypothetical protein n=1 Tax=Streptomyces sp. NPDC004126 TaxID=3390695 RepID=UPI003D0740E0
MHRRSTALHGVSAAVLALALTACGGDGGGGKNTTGNAGTVRAGGAGDGAGAPASPSPSASPKAQWGPALTIGQPAPQLYEPNVTDGGKFEVTVQKIVKGTPAMLKNRHFDEKLGDTPYFVYVTYTLKEGKPSYVNSDMNAHARITDETGEPVIKRPDVHSGFLEGGCPVPPVYLGWDVGESHTVCSIWIGPAAVQPTRLAWSPQGDSAEDFKKGASWKWATVPATP